MLVQQTLWSEDLPARASQSQGAAPDSQEPADSCGSMYELFENSVLNGLSGRTSRERSQVRTAKTSAACSKAWMNSGTVWHGECLTRSSSEWPSDAAVCSLSGILETGVPQKYFLSPRACAGILRRAEKRGKPLPRELKDALERQAVPSTGTEPKDDAGGQPIRR